MFLLSSLFLILYAAHQGLHSFPTRRSSDLKSARCPTGSGKLSIKEGAAYSEAATTTDRKSTRLNSSHVAISYAVFCLKKKTINCSQSTDHHANEQTYIRIRQHTNSII